MFKMFKKSKAINVYSPVKGDVISIVDVPDEMFSQKMLGDGFAVRPQQNEIFSPVKGKIISIFPTKHAIGILGDNGIEVLLHMGIDTVELEGSPFDIIVNVDDNIDESTCLAIADINLIQSNGKHADIIVAFTNLVDHQFMLKQTGLNEASTIIGSIH